MATVYRYAGSASHDTKAVEIEYRGPDVGWWVAGEGFTHEHHNWKLYVDAVVRDGKDPAGKERVDFPTAYFIDADGRLPVTKSWLKDQVNPGLDVS